MPTGSDSITIVQVLHHLGLASGPHDPEAVDYIDDYPSDAACQRQDTGNDEVCNNYGIKTKACRCSRCVVASALKTIESHVDRIREFIKEYGLVGNDYDVAATGSPSTVVPSVSKTCREDGPGNRASCICSRHECVWTLTTTASGKRSWSAAYHKG